jgi:hypothetical protein
LGDFTNGTVRAQMSTFVIWPLGAGGNQIFQSNAAGDSYFYTSKPLGFGTNSIGSTIVYNGANNVFTNKLGNLLIDNTNVTGQTIFTLGTNTSATNFVVENDTGTDIFTVSGDLSTTVAGTGLRLVDTGAGTNAITVRAGDGVTGVTAYTMTLPPAVGSAGQVLQTNASGVLSWVTAAGGSPGGADTNVQFKDGTAFGGDALFSFNKTTKVLSTRYLTSTGAGDITSNVSIGLTSLSSNISGTDNVAIGRTSQLNATGSGNTSVGSLTMTSASNTGSFNTSVGLRAGDNITTGSGNVVIGGVTSAGVGSPAFSITGQNNYISMGSLSTSNAFIQVPWTAVSDVRDKTEINNIEHGLDFVNQLNPISYKFRTERDSTETNGPTRFGFKAQDILELEGNSPVIVNNDDPEKLRVTDTYLIPVLVNAIKELSAAFELYKSSHP